MAAKYRDQNPFLNHLVIDRLFQYLNFDDLKSARQVCQFWKQRSTLPLVKRSCVKLQCRYVVKFLDAVKDPLVHDTFIMDSWEFTELGNPLLRQFFNIFGNRIKEINFCECIFKNQEILHEILNWMPNLEILTYGGSYVVDAEAGTDKIVRRYPTVSNLEITFGIHNMNMGTWSSIFKCFPNISVLNAQCKSSSSLTEMLLAIYDSKMILKDFSSFLTEMSETDLTSLINSNLKFKSLDTNLSSSVFEEQLKALLTVSSKTLESLKLFHGLEPGLPAGFPFGVSMANLKSLELVGDLVESMEFIRLLPRLISLTILQHDDSDEPSTTDIIRNTPQGLKPHSSLKTLSMEYMLTSECVLELGHRIAPNLTRLSAHLDDRSVRSVFESLTKLEELSILGTEVTDQGLTGIPMRDLLGEHDNMEAYRQYAYIGTSNCLRKISMYSQSQENVSDYAVIYGFMDAPELTVVEIPYSAITNAGILTLHLKPNIVRVSTKYFVDVLDGKAVVRPEEMQCY